MAAHHACSTTCGGPTLGVSTTDKMPGDPTGHGALEASARFSMAECRGKDECAGKHREYKMAIFHRRYFPIVIGFNYGRRLPLGV
ncbi:hypothetical protein BGC30_11375 [Novacetimonas hansenii]|nr:hypothetical protein BGC30_11375 [Novacetimonas hansenii]